MSSRDYGRGIRRESFGDFFGQERRPEPDYDRDFERRRSRGYDRDRDRDRFGPRGMEGDYGREGWPGYGSEGDWEGYYGPEGGYERGMNWGSGGDYGRGADWGPMGRGRYGGHGRYGTREEGFNRGQGTREGRDWGNWGGRDYWEDYGWGRNWPESRFREGYDWEAQRRGGYGASSGGYDRTGQFAGRGPRGYQRSDDRIREDISDRLTEHGDVDASDVEVDVQNGEVTLRGTVDSRYTKRLAEDIADTVSGVKDVRNELRVQRQAVPTGEHQAA